MLPAETNSPVVVNAFCKAENTQFDSSTLTAKMLFFFERSMIFVPRVKSIRGRESLRSTERLRMNRDGGETRVSTFVKYAELHLLI